MTIDKDKTVPYIAGILAHPHDESFCAALFTAFVQECEREMKARSTVQLASVNLYEDEFCPVIGLPELRRQFPIGSAEAGYLHILAQSRELVLFFPDWWGAEPAILKGFFDRIFRRGIVYDRADGDASGTTTAGLLGACGLTLWICSDSSGEQLQTTGMHYEQRFRSLSDYCGFRNLTIHLCSPLRGSNIRQRRSWLEECRKTAQLFVRQ